MSVAFETGDTNLIRQPGFAQAQGMWIYKSSETARFPGDDHRNSKFPVVKDQDDGSSSSSSIGKNSDASSGGGDSDDDGGEVQSLFKGSLNNLCALENALPLKRGISTFYAGKSKSYTSLADAVSVPSIQDIVKPEDAYNRKRKNMIAHSILLDKNRDFTSKNVISKRFANSNKGASVFPLNSKHESNASGESSSPGHSLPPLPAHPRSLPTKEMADSSPRIHCSSWRSFSLSDLQHAAVANSSSRASKRDEEDNND